MSTTKTKKKAIKEPSIEYEIGKQFMPVKDKAAVLDAIFHDANVKHGLTAFAAHKINALRELQSASGEELSALMAAILDKAFKDEL